jgi:hypothetical protein
MGVNPGYVRQGESAEDTEAIRVGNLAAFGEERVGLCNRHGVRLIADAQRPGGEEQIEVVVACSDEQRMLAWQLVGRRYAWRGYACSQAVAPFPDRERQAYYTTLLALRGNRPVGTITLGVDSQAGLLVDEVNRREVDLVRGQRRRTCELVRLAIEDGADSRRVWIALLESLNLLCRRIHDITDMFIEVNPRHAGFYRRVFGFRVMGPLRSCPRVGAPSVLLRLKREDLEGKLAGVAHRRAGAGLERPEALAA